MLRKAFQSALIQAFLRVEQTHDIVEQEEMISILTDIYINQPLNNIIQFPKFLEGECGLTPKVIKIVIKALLDLVDQSEIKILRLWLLFEIYEAMDILRNLRNNEQNAMKRRIVSEVFMSYDFGGSNIINLLRVCCTVIDQGEEDVQDMAEMIMEDKENEVAKIFRKELELVVSNPGHNIEEQMANIIEDYKFYVQGSLEQELQRQIAIAFAQKYTETREMLEKILPYQKLRRNIKELKILHKKEKYFISEDIEELYKMIQMKKDVYEGLYSIKAKVFSIDALKLERLLLYTTKTERLIEEKDVILMIGNTGSGKSTNILKFLGYDLKLARYKQLTTLVPKQELKPEHKTFYTSAEAQSCTRFINSAKIPEKMYRAGTAINKQTLVICDTPGFGDSAGVEVDIANGIGMINALYRARSVRVVVILPYDSLTKDRMSGLIQMSNTISQLINELPSAMESIAIYFNKVPADQISMIPFMIQSKLEHLNIIQRSNQKLALFLREVLERSKNQENFINPLTSDYKQLFNSLLRMQPINNIHQYFHYEFAPSTKQVIERFAILKKVKTMEYFQDKRYKMAQFQMIMLSKMMKILHSNEKIRRQYDDLIEKIQIQSQKEFSSLRQILEKIINNSENENAKQKFHLSQLTIIDMWRHFKGIEGLSVISLNEVEEAISQNQKMLQQRFRNFDQVTSELVQTVKLFATVTGSSIHSKISELVIKRFETIYINALQRANEKNFYEMKVSLKNISQLVNFCRVLSQNSQLNQVIDKISCIKQILRSQVQVCMQSISKDITRSVSKLTQKGVKQAINKISTIKAIYEFNFLDNNEEIEIKLGQQLRAIEKKCRNTIRGLQNLRLSYNQQEDGISIQKLELSNKKRQVDLLMLFDYVKDRLSNEYDQVKKVLANKFRQNVHSLKDGISFLRDNKGDEINKKLQKIKKTAFIIIQCFKIIDDAESKFSITQQIQQQFASYLMSETEKIGSFDLRLNLIKDETLKRVRSYYSNLTIYGQMSVIGETIKLSVQNMRSTIIDKLKQPFFQFKQKDLPSILAKGHFKYLPNTLEKFQKFASIALEIQNIVSLSQYDQIEKVQTQIKQSIWRVYQQMGHNIHQFLDMQFQEHEHPKCLKQLVKTLLAIESKPIACKYLATKLCFNVEEFLVQFKNKFRWLKKKIQEAFQQAYQSASLHKLVVYCKFYAEIEQIYESRGYSQSDFGFRDLKIQIQEQFTKGLKDDEEQILQIIEDNKPSQILFTVLKEYYMKYSAIKSQEAVRKRNFIVNQLRKVEQKVLYELNDFKHDIDDLEFFSTPNAEDFLEVFQEVTKLDKGLKELYSLEEDRNKIFIKQEVLRKYGDKTIDAFQVYFELVKEYLKDYNLVGANQKMRIFAQLETVIYEVIDIDNYSVYAADEKTPNGKLINFISENYNTLRAIIDSHPYLKEEKILIKKTKRLKNLLKIWKNGVEKQVKNKYDNFGPQFKLDENFENYYNNVEDSKRKTLKLNVEQFMKSLYRQYRQRKSKSFDLAESIQKNIESTIAMMPIELKAYHRQQLMKAKKDLK